MNIWGDVEIGNKFRAKSYTAYDRMQWLGWEWKLALRILTTDHWKHSLVLNMELLLLNRKILETVF